MGNRPSVSNLTSRYDEFLFAPICEEAGGMRLSVLSALARMNLDPWEEASRLAAMHKAIAQRALVSILDSVPNRNWEPSEAGAIAARLVGLLPQRSDGPTTAATEIAAVRAQRTSYWLVWVCIAIAISILSPHHQATTPNAGDSNSTIGAISQLKGSNANMMLPGVGRSASLAVGRQNP
jgi:hypothetical protein